MLKPEKNILLCNIKFFYLFYKLLMFCFKFKYVFKFKLFRNKFNILNKSFLKFKLAFITNFNFIKIQKLNLKKDIFIKWINKGDNFKILFEYNRFIYMFKKNCYSFFSYVPRKRIIKFRVRIFRMGKKIKKKKKKKRNMVRYIKRFFFYTKELKEKFKRKITQKELNSWSYLYKYYYHWKVFTQKQLKKIDKLEDRIFIRNFLIRKSKLKFIVLLCQYKQKSLKKKRLSKKHWKRFNNFKFFFVKKKKFFKISNFIKKNRGFKIFFKNLDYDFLNIYKKLMWRYAEYNNNFTWSRLNEIIFEKKKAEEEKEAERYKEQEELFNSLGPEKYTEVTGLVFEKKEPPKRTFCGLLSKMQRDLIYKKFYINQNKIFFFNMKNNFKKKSKLNSLKFNSLYSFKYIYDIKFKIYTKNYRRINYVLKEKIIQTKNINFKFKKLKKIFFFNKNLIFNRFKYRKFYKYIKSIYYLYCKYIKSFNFFNFIWNFFLNLNINKYFIKKLYFKNYFKIKKNFLIKEKNYLFLKKFRKCVTFILTNARGEVKFNINSVSIIGEKLWMSKKDYFTNNLIFKKVVQMLKLKNVRIIHKLFWYIKLRKRTTVFKWIFKSLIRYLKYNRIKVLSLKKILKISHGNRDKEFKKCRAKRKKRRKRKFKKFF